MTTILTDLGLDPQTVAFLRERAAARGRDHAAGWLGHFLNDDPVRGRWLVGVREMVPTVVVETLEHHAVAVDGRCDTDVSLKLW